MTAQMSLTGRIGPFLQVVLGVRSTLTPTGTRVQCTWGIRLEARLQQWSKSGLELLLALRGSFHWVFKYSLYRKHYCILSNPYSERLQVAKYFSFILVFSPVSSPHWALFAQVGLTVYLINSAISAWIMLYLLTITEHYFLKNQSVLKTFPLG